MGNRSVGKLYGKPENRFVANKLRIKNGISLSGDGFQPLEIE